MVDLQYYLAESEEEYTKIGEFANHVIKEEGFTIPEDHQEPLEFPTIYSLNEEGQIMSMITTRTCDGQILMMASLVDARLKPRAQWLLQIWEIYRNTLRNFGITKYWGYVSKSNKKMFELTCARGLIPIAQTADAWWFEEHL